MSDTQVSLNPQGAQNLAAEIEAKFVKIGTTFLEYSDDYKTLGQTMKDSGYTNVVTHYFANAKTEISETSDNVRILLQKINEYAVAVSKGTAI